MEKKYSSQTLEGAYGSAVLQRNNRARLGKTVHVYSKNALAIYDCQSKTFCYRPSMEEYFGTTFDMRPLWQILKEENLASEAVANALQVIIEEIAQKGEPQVYFTEYLLGVGKQRWYRVGFVYDHVSKKISITFTDIEEEITERNRTVQTLNYDELTGLYNRKAFVKIVEQLVQKREEEAAEGKFALLYFDVVRFKAINDMFGMKEGDHLLQYIAEVLCSAVKEDDIVCRLDADKFALFLHNPEECIDDLMDTLYQAMKQSELPCEIPYNIGIYVTTEEKLSVGAMLDRAVLAQSVIKGSYTNKYHYYTESLRNAMLSEQEIVGMMENALAEEQFIVQYQPQYDHATGMVVGAEALVRWRHPEKGLISPGLFIPIFEKNGFVVRLDLYVFEQACRFLRKCLDAGRKVVPVSTNFCRHDIFQPNFVEKLEEIREKYGIPVKYLRVEITESAIMGNSMRANEIINKLHECGYIVEMDDFGSGYSSLNVLKDIELDILKLDMLFFSEKQESNRGGTILSSIIRMAKWLSMPVIAEGVETAEQADFLCSIGCNYIQGYFYSKPLPEEAFESLLLKERVDHMTPQLDLLQTFDAGNFWDPKSQETLIFSNYVGGAAIFDYHDGKVELLRVNKKYLQEIGMNLSEKDFIEQDPMLYFDEVNKKVYFEMLDRAIETMEEQECETWRTISSSCCGNEHICIRSTVRMIGKSDGNHLFYVMIRNVTAEKERFREVIDNEKRFKMASEQINIYYWEYTVATREMRPCFRCMRDLGLPALLTNYPDSAIEMGVFPPEVAEMYRDWHRQIAEGVETLEAVIPLTVGRVPFRVRYTTEFDESGRPVKAYGSATLVV